MSALERELTAIVGAAHVTVEDAALARLSGDLSLERFQCAEACVAPADADEVMALVRWARCSGRTLTVRGGAMSYTRSHVPARPGVVLLDIRRLNRILEINARDRYVTVEAGVTWEQLYLALREHGVRTPFWGPLSGRVSTVGGALSQNALFLGFAGHGVVTQSVLGLDAVLGDGSRVRTGSGASLHGTPFWRDFGPDLTGLFLGDGGAMGVKLAATLRLIPLPEFRLGASFRCADASGLLAAMEAAAGSRLASDLYGFDRGFNALLGPAGFAALEGAPFSVHALVEAGDRAVAEASLAALRRLIAPHAREVPGSLPMSIVADPFGAMRAIFRGARPAAHLPTNAIVPWSAAERALTLRDELLAEHAGAIAAHGLETWTLFAASPGSFNIEPAIVLEDDLGPRSRAPEARAAALALRHDLSRRFDALGAMHVQLGKYYAFVENLDPATREALVALRAAIDPDGVIAPDVLGLTVASSPAAAPLT